MKRGKLFYRLQRHFRNKRFQVFDALLRRILATQAEVSILDAGGRPDYWASLPPDLREMVRITCLNFEA